MIDKLKSLGPKKIIKYAVLFIFIGLLVFVLIRCALIFGYYPHYKSHKQVLNIEYNAEENENKVRIMSCNVRCLNPMDYGKKSWFYRADIFMKGIEQQAPGVIGFQEVTKWQYSYLKDCLPQYDSIITYRDELVNTEGCPVFYRTDLYNLIDKNSFWLSETPDVMSKGWGAACYRICTYAILEDIATGERFVIFNTHLDHVSEEARINGINLVLEKIKQFGGYPAVIMGDFNAEEGTPTYISVTENFLDAKYQTENTMKSCTYQDFGKMLDAECIDYFMISKTGFKVDEYKVLTDTYDGVYASDHFQLFTLLTFDNE